MARKYRGFQDRRAAVRLRLLNAHPYCHWCGNRLDWETATIDHLIPRSRGGDHSDANLVLACKGCNDAKKDMMPEEFLKAVSRGMVRIGGAPRRLVRHPLYRPPMAGVAI